MLEMWRKIIPRRFKTEAQASPEPTRLSPGDLHLKFPYGRPEFLGLNSDCVDLGKEVSINRPILEPPEEPGLIRRAGFAEAIQGSRAKPNEDQAALGSYDLRLGEHGKADCRKTTVDSNDCSTDIFTYFGIFDGHAGPDAAIVASRQLHEYISSNLSAICKRVKHREETESEDFSLKFGYHGNPIEPDELVIGALENAFMQMDQQIEKERFQFRIMGGCTAVVALFYNGNLYLANAGDSRAVISCEGRVERETMDFTPETDRKRLQSLAAAKPELLGKEFIMWQFPRRVLRKDLGKMILARGALQDGWSMKKITERDVGIQFITGRGKTARLLATIGTTRGFGDHDLRVFDSNITIKPFLTAMPQVSIYELESRLHGPDDVLIMGTDGLWDVLTSMEAADLVNDVLKKHETGDSNRYQMAARALVEHARGVLCEADKKWRAKDDPTKLASYDDISCFVIPLCPPSADICPSGNACPSGADVLPSGAAVRPSCADPSGADVCSSGNVCPSGADVRPSGAAVRPSCADPSGADVCSAGADDFPSGADVCPSGADICPSGADIRLSGADICSSGNVCLSGADDCTSGADVCPSGAYICPSGADDYPSGADNCPSGADACPSGADICPSSADIRLSGADDCPSGADVCPSGADIFPSGADICLSGADVHLSGADVRPSGAAVRPSGVAVRPPCADPSGTDVCSAGADDCPSGADVCSAGADVRPSDTDIRPSDADSCPSDTVISPSDTDI